MPSQISQPPPISRRSFIGATAAGLCAAAIPQGCTMTRSTEDRPNILLIMTDQQAAYAMSCAGDEHVKTPAMDSLAARGVRFERAYCPTPLCVPCRTSIQTGRMPREVGAAYNTWEQPPDIAVPMLGAAMRDAGYETGYVGKWHVRLSTDAAEHHGYTWMRDIRNNFMDPRLPDTCEAFLRQKHDKPFFLSAMFVNPHDICEWARGDELKNGPIGPTPPPEQCPPLPANFEIPEGEPDALRGIVRAEASTQYPTIGWPDDRWRQYRWAYRRMTEKVDALIGRVLASLDDSPYRDNTIVIFASDHGDGDAAHRWNQKQVLYEEAARVPLIVVDPRSRRESRTADELINLGLDLFPTICDYGRAKVPDDLHGQSIKPIIDGTAKGWRDQVVIDTDFCEGDRRQGVMGRALRTDRYKYTVYDKGERREMLIDLQEDPGEMRNLAGMAEHEAVLQEHRRRLRQWCRDTGDPFTLA